MGEGTRTYAGDWLEATAAVQMRVGGRLARLLPAEMEEGWGGWPAACNAGSRSGWALEGDPAAAIGPDWSLYHLP